MDPIHTSCKADHGWSHANQDDEGTPTPSYWKRKSLREHRGGEMNSGPFRGGMQVHAVPEAERAFDANGVRLPWGYEYADADRRRLPEERGPFGRNTKRRTQSRSKTQTPARTQGDRDAAENWKTIDEIFSRVKEQDNTKDKGAATGTTGGEAGGLPPAPVVGTPTEVILYGFPSAFQYAAIEHYERVSQGSICEDYDRQPTNAKYDTSLSQGRLRSSQRLSKEALKKRNRYHGGNHWIKVTFDSAEAAERACYFSPHVIHGSIVHAEMYRGTGPAAGDVSIPATEEALRLSSAPVSPEQSRTLGATSPSSDTFSSATATGGRGALGASSAQSPPRKVDRQQQLNSNAASPLALPPSAAPGALVPSSASTSTAVVSQADKPLRIRGAKRAVLLPAEQALLPAPNRLQRVISHVPIIGSWAGFGSDGVVGSEIPRKEDGSFDYEKAGYYWRFWYMVDWVCGTEFCGGKGE